MKLIIAEKPSVARDIAAVVGATERVANGKGYYLRGNGYMVSNVRGHFISLAMPEAYDEKYKTWNLEDLPIIPQKFHLVPLEDKTGELMLLSKLMKSPEVDTIICATDAGREGELIFRLIYDYLKCTKPIERLWISSMTDDAIEHGMAHLLPGTEKDNLYQAALVRAQCDWLTGLNLSRLYSIYFQTKYPVGRVQTATLNLIVQRDYEISHFTKSTYYKLLLSNGAEWYHEDANSFATEAEAEKIRNICAGKQTTVIKADKKQKTENRPLLYSLTSLQQDANDKYGYSAALTLITMQSLYEKKLLTYPRTDSNYLTDDMPPTINLIIQKLAFYACERVETLISSGLNIDERVIDNSKVSDHHAIIPTTEIAKMQDTELSDEENKILDLVIMRFLNVFEQPYIYNEISYEFDVANEKFRIKTKTPVSLGWKKYDGVICSGDDEAELPAIPAMNVGDTFIASNLTVHLDESTPPKPYTDSTLLAAMEHISRKIDNHELKKYVTERGLGTSATRAAIIERIVSHEYVTRSGKSLKATDKGRRLISAVLESIKSPEMTANMECMLLGVEKGLEPAAKALGETIRLVENAIEFEAAREHQSQRKQAEPLGKCPRCGGAVYEGKKGFFCENAIAKPPTCIFSLWKDDYFFLSKQKTLSGATLKTMLTKGKALVKGLYSSSTGKTYDAYVSFADRKDKDGKDKVGFTLEFADNSKGAKK